MTRISRRTHPLFAPPEIARMVADAIWDKKGLDVELLEVGDLLTITEYFVIATGTSGIHVRALAEGVEEALAEKAGRKPLRREGVAEAEWALLDYGDVVVHLFQPDQREYYGLERLWRDAPRLEWEAPVSSET